MPVKKILVIDDEEAFCRALKKALELKTNFQVLTTTQGVEGIQLAKAQRPDVILLDVMMPGMFGTQVAEKLSEDPVTRSIPIIFVTAVITPAENSANHSITDRHHIIAKPVKIDEVIQKINEV